MIEDEDTQETGPIVLGGYRIGPIIGAGGFGTVYKALDKDDKPIALKVMSSQFVTDDMRKRFEREGTIRIDHENVVEVYDAGQDGDNAWIALELLIGEPLTKRLARGVMPPAEAIDLGLQVCAGLAAAHGEGIVHRDLKPGNVYLCEGGPVKVLDFGIARAVMEGKGSDLTMEGSVIGTPGYLAPEQARGEREVDIRADIWALGVLLYQALAGENPFLRGSSMATILAVVLEEVAPVGSKARGLPPGLGEAVDRCLEKDRDKRWQTAQALAEALRAVDPALAGAPDTLREASAHSVSLPADERRVVALLLADAVVNLPMLTSAVTEFGGELIPMLGNRAIGVFGGVTWEGDEAIRAVSAALMARTSAVYIAVGAGHATGAGGTVSGDAVRSVQRACEAKLAGVAVDGRAARGLGGFPLEKVEAGIFEVKTAAPSTALILVPDSRSEVDIVGRAAELAQLKAAAAMLIDEERPVVAWVSGPPGIGKTRLRQELFTHLTSLDEAPRVLLGRGRSHRRETALHLIGSVFRHAAFSGTADEARQSALVEFCRQGVGDDAAARDCAAAIGPLVGLEPSTATGVGRSSDPQLASDRLRVALSDVLIGLCSRGPVALALDDVQWADEESLSFLEDLLERAADLPLLLFVAARTELSETHPDLFAGQDVIRVVPRGLVLKQVARLAKAIAGEEIPPALAQTITERTEGNPFFIEQIVRELAEKQLLTTNVTELPIPIDVEAAVQSRLDHLPQGEKLLCKRAAVYGQQFNVGGVTALGIEDPPARLLPLSRRGLVSSRGRGGSTEYQFRTALVADVAYRMTPDPQRQELHRRAAEFLAREGSEPEEVASHFERGGTRREAARFYVRATLGAARIGDTQSVLRCSQKALDLGAGDDVRFELRMARADALSFLGRREEQAWELDAALDAASNTRERARALTEKVGLHAALGSHDKARWSAEEAVATARESGVPDVLAVALSRQTWALLYAGAVDEAAKAIEEAASLLGQIRPESAALVAAWQAQLATARGDLGKRREAYNRAIAQYGELGDRRRQAQAESNLADTENRLGDYTRAEAALRDSLSLSRRVKNRTAEGFALANLGYALTMLGRVEEALSVFAEGARIATEVEQTRLAIAIRVYRARALLRTQPPDEVVREAEAAADEARRGDMPTLSVAALAIAAQAWLENDPQMALALSRRSMQLHDELGVMEEDEIEVFLTHARALIANGDEAAAKEVVERGLKRLDELAERIEDPVQRNGFLLNVEAHRGLRAVAQGLSVQV